MASSPPAPNASRVSPEPASDAASPDSRRAILNLLEDAVAAREAAEREASERRRAEDALRESQARQTFLLQLSDALRPLSSSAAVRDRATTMLGAHLQVNRMLYADIEDGYLLVHPGYVRDLPPLEGKFPMLAYGEALLPRYTRGETVAIDDVRTSPLLSETDRAFYATHGIAAFVCAILLKEGHPIAAFGAHQATPRAWTAGEMELIREVAERTWSAGERARAEAALRTSEERARLAMQTVGLGTWDWDLVTGNVVWSREHNRMYGLPEDQRIGTYEDWIPHVHPDDRDRVAAELRAALNERRDYAADMRAVHVDGTIRWIAGHGRGFYAADGRPVRMLGIVRDITSEKTAEDDLRAALAAVEAAGRAKDQFLAVLSHELRTPLSPVLMTLKMLARRRDFPEGARASLDLIERNIKVEARLIDDLLDITRIGRGTLECSRAAMDLHEAVRAAIEVVTPDLRDREQVLFVTLNADHPHLEGDSTRLQQVTWNLLKNASKFSPPRSEIRVVTSREGDMLRLAVTDHGIGIAPDKLATIFEAFTQGGDFVAREFGGLGLGLTISRATVAAHHGRIWADSEGPGKGATFTVELPAPPLP